MATREHVYVMNSCIRGYHVYKDDWIPVIGEELECARELDNRRDRYAVKAMKDGTTVGHLPAKISIPSSLFLRSGGRITCTVTGRRKYSNDLEQGGLEIPCRVTFSGQRNNIRRLVTGMYIPVHV